MGDLLRRLPLLVDVKKISQCALKLKIHIMLHMPVFPAHRKKKQEEQKFEPGLDYMRTCVKIYNKQKKNLIP